MDDGWNAKEGEPREEGCNKCITMGHTANYRHEQLLVGWKWGAVGGDNNNGEDSGSEDGGGGLFYLWICILYIVVSLV